MKTLTGTGYAHHPVGVIPARAGMTPLVDTRFLSRKGLACCFAGKLSGAFDSPHFRTLPIYCKSPARVRPAARTTNEKAPLL